jgi:hypothetical protein
MLKKVKAKFKKKKVRFHQNIKWMEKLKLEKSAENYVTFEQLVAFIYGGRGAARPPRF